MGCGVAYANPESGHAVDAARHARLRAAARKVVGRHARDEQDLELLLSALGLDQEETTK